MPRKRKPSARSAHKTITPYPDPLPASVQSHPAPSISTSKSPSDSADDGQRVDWTAENARAKAIIMSTLVPGSEPWQIVEPLEYAADIWRALEERYGSHKEERGGHEEERVRGKEDSDETAARAWRDNLSRSQPSMADDDLAQGRSDRGQATDSVWGIAQDTELARPTAVSKEPAEESGKWNNDLLRDKRFLWALLNGGKRKVTGQTGGGKGHARETAS